MSVPPRKTHDLASNQSRCPCGELSAQPYVASDGRLMRAIFSSIMAATSTEKASRRTVDLPGPILPPLPGLRSAAAARRDARPVYARQSEAAAALSRLIAVGSLLLSLSK